ncbi:unnamed protein product [Cylicostephanus goldi]|uniref:Uncharacterized protein n=1 Tax=Cylicostephanus goldi TaxID=71465 RepID=A0A3P7NP53_CYLGO|nr:unnamed protein product [Cylicostephanus goldi]
MTDQDFAKTSVTAMGESARKSMTLLMRIG